MMEKYDVIVVGSGPAGATAAYYLGEAGLSVLVIEKENLPRYKTCGGGLSSRFLRENFPFSFDTILSSDVKAVTYDMGEFSVTVPVRPGEMGMVMRADLDRHILSHARVSLQQGDPVKRVEENTDEVLVTSRQGKTYRTRYLIGADGANSVVAHETGLRQEKELAAAIEVEVQVDTQTQQVFQGRPVFIFGEMRYGYLWIFPKADHLSVGIAALHPKRGELQSRLKEVMKRYGIPIENVPFHGHPIPIFSKYQSISTKRVLLVGDAAGLADPLSGEGIRYAIKSGRLASQAIISGQPEQYEVMIYQHITRNHHMARRVALVFYRLQSMCIRLGAPNPFTTQAILDLLSDRAATSAIMLRPIATLPLFIGTEVIARLGSLLAGPQLGQKVRRWVYHGLDVSDPSLITP
ncbi:MAG: geranylgeranyl reductase family protein [Anaerolineales bacterium]|jgi:geranylgeranyl reductase family protein